MIEKMKRTPKAKHGWKVWINNNSLLDDINRLNKYLQCNEFSLSQRCNITNLLFCFIPIVMNMLSGWHMMKLNNLHEEEECSQ